VSYLRDGVIMPGSWLTLEVDGDVERYIPKPGLWTGDVQTDSAILRPGVRMIWLSDGLADKYPINYPATGIVHWLAQPGGPWPGIVPFEIRGRVTFTGEGVSAATGVYVELSEDDITSIRVYALKCRVAIRSEMSGDPLAPTGPFTSEIYSES
jgi:hypothetical protein